MPAVKAIKNRIAATVDKLDNLFGRGVVVAGVAVVAVAVAVSVAALWMVSAAAPTTLTMVSGPKGSVFERYAQQYQKILARSGVKLRIVPTQGALDNLKKLADPKARVDVGFVLGGEADGLDIGNLMSLGSVAYQPLMVFYRGAHKHALGEFKGERVDIGAPGSGTHVLATQLLKLNGLDPQSDQGIARVQSPLLAVVAMQAAIAELQGHPVPQLIELPVPTVYSKDLKDGVNYSTKLPDNFQDGADIAACNAVVPIDELLKQSPDNT